ncbi:MAG: sulfur carrier protein ThiS [Candidatus Velthaea sp.]|jgi:sulfur carrier protein
MMIVSVNGVAHEIDAGTTLGDLIARLGVRRDGIAVARNDDVVARGAIDATLLGEGDAIEIIAAVAGG